MSRKAFVVSCRLLLTKYPVS